MPYVRLYFTSPVTPRRRVQQSGGVLLWHYHDEEGRSSTLFTLSAQAKTVLRSILRSRMRTLTRIFAHKLLGEFTHEVLFPTEDEFVVIIGPNGVGKTRLLELVHAIFRSNFGTIVNTEFDILSFDFSDGTHLEINKKFTDDDYHQVNVDLYPTFAAETNLTTFEIRPHFKLSISRIGKETIDWKPLSPDVKGLDRLSAREVQKFMEVVYQGNILIPGSISTTHEPLTFGNAFDRHLRNRSARSTIMETPDEISDFLSSVTVHLIETQRLVIFRNEQDSRSDRERHRTNTVEEFASHLKQQIADVLAQNSRTTQQLDRSFPRRVLATSPLEYDTTDEIIRERYRNQSAFRDALEDIGVLDMQEDVPISEDSLDDWQRRVLSVYLDDTDQKLSTFQWLLDRINLLRSIVNARFLGKSLKVDREAGFRFELKRTGRRLDPSQLSSGEQHEIVLLYDLLFNVTEGSLVLIDEPEISLNVAWQRQFLADIQRIANLANLRFIIATHSPQIIHKWSKRVSPLGPPEAGEEKEGRTTK